MIICVASGKGGTGKTTLAVNLALALSIPGTVWLLDCDVEEPNCHIFLKPDIQWAESVGIPTPVVDETRCTACGECGRICQYHAIVSLKSRALVFPELCHGCGGCVRVCPKGAIKESMTEVGVIEGGVGDKVNFVQGLLNIGQAMPAPLIRAVRRHAVHDGLIIVDCPPGTSCPVIAAIKGSDFVLLVTEPTPFGLHDLTLAVETVRQLKIPHGAVINRADNGDGQVMDYCRREGIPVLMQIPDERRIAEAYSAGKMAIDVFPQLRKGFEKLYKDIVQSLPLSSRGTAGV
ncbi:MAG: ATP-binding protein [bacterium]